MSKSRKRMERDRLSLFELEEIHTSDSPEKGSDTYKRSPTLGRIKVTGGVDSRGGVGSGAGVGSGGNVGGVGNRGGGDTVESLRKKYYFELDHLRKAGNSCLSRLEPFLPKDIFADFMENLNLDVRYVSPPGLDSIDLSHFCENCEIYRINYEKDVGEANETIAALQAEIASLKKRAEISEKAVPELEIMKLLMQELVQRNVGVADFATSFLINLRNSYMRKRGRDSHSPEDKEQLFTMQSSIMTILNNVVRGATDGVGSGGLGGAHGVVADGTGAAGGGPRTGDPGTGVAHGGDGAAGDGGANRAGSGGRKGGGDKDSIIADALVNGDDARCAKDLNSAEGGPPRDSFANTLANQQNSLCEMTEKYERMREKFLAANAKVERLELTLQIASSKNQREERKKMNETLRQGERMQALPTIGAPGCLNPEKKAEEEVHYRPTRKFRHVAPPHKTIRLPLHGLPKDLTLPPASRQFDFLSFHHGMSWSAPQLDMIPRSNMVRDLAMFPLDFRAGKSADNDDETGNPESELYLKRYLM
eukprot:GEMP01033614.1.p1 GENE.GEMP01033614.1~~GEMP01033614.1.p1  ORF type:complete len:534 (+),score=126.32 GEMP01033614.1:214-1815(+)